MQIQAHGRLDWIAGTDSIGGGKAGDHFEPPGPKIAIRDQVQALYIDHGFEVQTIARSPCGGVDGNSGRVDGPVQGLHQFRLRGSQAPRPTQLMGGIAALTGGVASYLRNDIDVAIREAIDDGRVSYTLGFYPSGGDRAVPVH